MLSYKFLCQKDNITEEKYTLLPSCSLKLRKYVLDASKIRSEVASLLNWERKLRIYPASSQNYSD
jgi:hypothetical protein